jgi:DNA invertase Pin-like site-specific DNA recombinase
MSQLPKLSVGRPRRFVPPEQIRELRRKGLSFRQIARKTGFGYGSVRRAFGMAEASGGTDEESGHNHSQTTDTPIPGRQSVR